MFKIEAINNFLHSQPFYMCQLFTAHMEVQVNVAADNGEPVQGIYAGKRWHGFTDGLQTWKSFRIPWDAATNPHYNDSPISWDISRHAEAIGMTGWDWKNKQSKWVGFDFDALVEHKKGLTEDELQYIKNTLENLDFVSIFTSTGGYGLHIYIFIDNPMLVQTHTEHAAVARAILNKISALTGLQLATKVDTLGGNIWVWHRRAVFGTSYEIIKQGKIFKDIPHNWRDYLSLVSHGRIPTTHKAQELDDIISANKTIQLEPEHVKVLRWFENSDALWWWDDTRQMLVCHTADLKRAHIELSLRGLYDTIATGKERGRDQNCFCFPLQDGGWIARRHTRGTSEHSVWFIDSSGWTTCYYNRPPTIRAISNHFGAVEGEKSYHFKTLDNAVNALLAMGIDCPIDKNFRNRPAEISKLPDGKLKLAFEKVDYDTLDGWVEKKNEWCKIFFNPTTQEDVLLPDTLIRHVTVLESEFGWFVNTHMGWVQEPKNNLISVLLSKNYKRSEIEIILGRCIEQNWRLVNKPFQPEYPGNREWNKGAAQFRVKPQQGSHPTWDLIFEHCGGDLTESLRDNTWAKQAGILTGLLYLQAWTSAFLKFPNEPVPYLFLVGPQNSGKSIFHEALSLLFTSGYCRADNALTSPSGFNGELSNAVLCVVEETNLSRKGYASDRIKDWVTGRTINIHSKGKTPYHVVNTTHWIQCANDSSYCPIFPGDTRITMIKIEPLKEEIPKPLLIEKLEAEKAAFLFDIMEFELPIQIGRLKIPVIETQEKHDEMEFNKTPLERFIDERIYSIPGVVITFSEFYDKFISWLPIGERNDWSTKRVGRNVPLLKGKYGNANQLHLGNVSFEPDKMSNIPLEKVGDRLCQKSVTH